MFTIGARALQSPYNVCLSMEHNISTFIAVIGMLMYCALNILTLLYYEG